MPARVRAFSVLRSLGLCGVAFSTLWLGSAQLSPTLAAAEGPVYVDDGYAIGGYDPVAYFTEERPVEGQQEFEAEWNGATWQFASAENRERFLEDPEAYAPAYGGFCAWAVAARGELYSVDPHVWKIVDGTLYLNFNQDIQQRWERDIPGFIQAADAKWPEIRE